MWKYKLYYGRLTLECNGNSYICIHCAVGRILRGIIPSIIDSGYVSCNYGNHSDSNTWRDVLDREMLNVIWINTPHVIGRHIHAIRNLVVKVDQYAIPDLPRPVTIGVYKNI